MIQLTQIGRTERFTAHKVVGNRYVHDIKSWRDSDNCGQYFSSLPFVSDKVPDTPVGKSYSAVRPRLEPLGLYSDRST
jgi:hypothetical protein